MLRFACLLSFSRLLLIAVAAPAIAATPAPFDLAGPTLEVTVTRGATTLPIAEVPNLAAGDRVWLKADLPADQSTHYLLVVAFLRGATNPPPESWFFPCKTWTGKCAAAGLSVLVPAEAQQVLVLLAPQTSGDFKTLMGAVRGRPGAFVRTSQDLNQAALDRSRLERYLTTIRSFNDADPAKLAQVAPLMARSLAIKVDDKCLDKVPALQVPCLMQGQEALILNDGHSTSIVEALTSGPGSDLAMEASYTPQLSYGYYSPYIASVLDIARIFDSFTTAQYQYIPALASNRGDRLALTLNAAPSFHNPKSVLVSALPAVEPTQLPPLHAVDPKEIYCARKTALVLPVEGAPLVFATRFAHDLTLSLSAEDGRVLELPATADPTQGGYVVDTTALGTTALGDSMEASLHGRWGFENYQGPRFRLMNAHSHSWELSGDPNNLIAGRQDTIHLRADSVSCVDGIMLKDPAGKELRAEWKSVKPTEVEVKLPLQETQPGPLMLMVTQYGMTEPQPVPLRLFAEAGHFVDFSLHAGDSVGTLQGSHLDEVASLSIKAVKFLPDDSPRTDTSGLLLTAQDVAAAAALKSERNLIAKVTLRDGRVVPLVTAIDAARPKVTLLGSTVRLAALPASNIRLNDNAQLPQDATLIFSLRSQAPASFSRDDSIDVASNDESVATSLSINNGGLTMQTSQVMVATLIPSKAFGASTFGPLKFRVNVKGIVSEWMPLTTLVRLPTLQDLTCPDASELACKLQGANLYLLEAVAGDAEFVQSQTVPDGFVGAALPVPHPQSGALYVKLRDDPHTVNLTTLTAQVLPTVQSDSARSEARREAVQ